MDEFRLIIDIATLIFVLYCMSMISFLKDKYKK